MPQRIRNYTGEKIDVTYDTERCVGRQIQADADRGVCWFRKSDFTVVEGVCYAELLPALCNARRTHLAE